MMPLSFDELNRLVGFKRSIPIDIYFGEMQIDAEQQKRRKDTAERLEDEFFEILAWAFYTQQSGKLQESAVKNRLKGAFETVLGTEVRRLPETEDMIDLLSSEIARTTVDRGDEDPFFLSADRARLLAEDNSNNFWNYYDFDNALSRGKKWKYWNTILDGRERISHNLADGQMQPILMPFEVGDSLLMYPKDTSLGASLEEIINCRCSVTYA